VITCVGEVRVARRHYRCARCGCAALLAVRTPLDAWAGLESGHLSPRARRLVALAGSTWSFDVASERLKEMCHLRVSDQTVRRVSDAAGEQARQWMEASAKPVEAFERAEGQVEFYTDGTMVNTRSGWREMRLGLFSKRPAGEAASVQQWADRHLPDPTARLTYARFATSAQVGDLIGGTAHRLNLDRGRDVSALGDGALWIWKQTREHLPDAEQTLDVYHLREHLFDTAGALYGQGSEASSQWVQSQFMTLRGEGSKRYLHDHLIPQTRQAKADGPSGDYEALRAWSQYVWSNRGRLHYADRLARGLPIGSGQVEGACKTVVGRRLKLNSARWRPERAEHIAALTCLQYGDLWKAYWEN